MKYEVVAVDVTGVEPVISVSRTEVVDAGSNAEFRDCKTLRDVEMRYEQFWNYPNSDGALHNPKEKVKVLTVRRISN